MIDKATVLRKALESKSILRVVGAHNGLGAKLVERHGFDGIWASGLEISTAHAVPDANILTMTENLEAARAINEATRLPVVCDCDTGYGNASNVIHMVRRYEAAGLAAVVIEDKRFPKVNSFIPGRQELVSREEFVGKIEAAKKAQQNPDFMVFARVEALIAGWALEEAVRRAREYERAGADGIVIHSKAKTPDEIYAFARMWKGSVPLVAIPTTYFHVKAEELAQQGFRMVIYANHGLRAAIRAVEKTFQSIRDTDSTAAVEDQIASLQEVFEIQGMGEMKEEEKRFITQERFQVVIPAARDHRFQPDLKELLKDQPLCMLKVGSKTVLERQVDLLSSFGVTEILVVGGFLHEKIQVPQVKVLYNPDYAACHCAGSILFAQDHLQGRTLVVYSDILFDRKILGDLLESPHEVTLVIDRAYRTLPFRNKPLDLVAAGSPSGAKGPRSLGLDTFKPIHRIGKGLSAQVATDEFIGMALLSAQGLQQLKHAWKEASEKFSGRSFYEAGNVRQADFTDLIQYLIDRGTPVFGMEIEHGWSEIHSLEDYTRVNAYLKESETLSPSKTFATAL